MCVCAYDLKMFVLLLLAICCATANATASFAVTPSGPPVSVWSSVDQLHKCGVNDTPDIPARVFIDANGLVHMIVGSTSFHLMTGPSIFNQTRSCASTWNSTQSPDESLYAAAQWLNPRMYFPTGQWSFWCTMSVRLQAAPSAPAPARWAVPRAHGGLLFLCTQFSHPSFPFFATTDTNSLLQTPTMPRGERNAVAHSRTHIAGRQAKGSRSVMTGGVMAPRAATARAPCRGSAVQGKQYAARKRLGWSKQLFQKSSRAWLFLRCCGEPQHGGLTASGDLFHADEGPYRPFLVARIRGRGQLQRFVCLAVHHRARNRIRAHLHGCQSPTLHAPRRCLFRLLGAIRHND